MRSRGVVGSRHRQHLPGVTGTITVLMLAAAQASPPASLQVDTRSARATRSSLALAQPDATLGSKSSAGAPGASACVADVCQPRVDVPGYAPQFADRRQELFIALLQRTPLKPVASVANVIASTNLFVDYRPPHFDGSSASGHGGWGKLLLEFRLRLDASNLPSD
jgi:hypothetical protein